MTTPPPLPKQLKRERHNTYKLEEFIGKDDNYIKNCSQACILVKYDVLANNIELLKRIINLRKDSYTVDQINCLDYESALLLEGLEELDENIIIALIDDYENKDRSYIDTTKFKKHKFHIPLTYFMWGVKFEESCDIYCLRNKENDTMHSSNGDSNLQRKTILTIKSIIDAIYGNVETNELTILDKCILVSNYLQSKVQYVLHGLKTYADKVYIVDADESEVTREKVGSLNTVLDENYGLCMAIANATTLLLNNPIMNVNIRSIFGEDHVWNVVIVDGKQYYIDNTWLITRNKNRVEGALKATRFSDEYLLFGEEKALKIDHHKAESYINGKLEQMDFDREKINEAVMKLTKKNMKTDYATTLRFKSKIEE